MSLVKVKDEPGLVRDTRSNAILSNDQGALKAYKARKQKERDLEDLRNKVDLMEGKLINIESLLVKLVEKENSE